MNEPRNISGKSVAVVGGAGFLGSHLVNYLIEEKDCLVTVVDNLITGRLEFLHSDAQFEHHDITGSEDYLRKLFVLTDAEFVFNYAAQPYIPDSFERPLRVFDINAMGALKVINAAYEAGCPVILQVSSAEIYGNCAGAISENAKATPHSTYGASKLAIDSLIQARWRENQTPAIALRQFNCVGERETHPYVVPEIISQLVHSDQKRVHLGNDSTRDFLYAGDAVKMAVELAEKGEFGEVYNLGSEDCIRIYELAALIGRVLYGNKTVIKVVEDESRKRPWEIWHLKSNNSKIYSVIESRPTVSLWEALKRTVAYYTENSSKWIWEK